MLLNVALVLILQLCQSNALHLTNPQRREKFDLAFYVYDGDWPCKQAELDILETAIDDTHTLAQAAIDILNVEGAETSRSFTTWFGEENALPRRRTAILNNHYKSVKTNLIKPEVAVKFREATAPHFPDASVKPTKNSLVYACPPAGYPLCRPGILAAVQSSTEQMSSIYGTTMIIFCKDFFATMATIESSLLKWKLDNDLSGLFSRSFILLHEVQHMMQATGDGERADDLVDPNPRVFGNIGCYSPDCCTRLPDAHKLKNAQNYAIFALDVTAFPLLGAPASDDDCSWPNRKREEKQHWRRADTTTSNVGTLLRRFEFSNASNTDSLLRTPVNTPVNTPGTLGSSPLNSTIAPDTSVLELSTTSTPSATPQTTPGSNTPQGDKTPGVTPRVITSAPTTMMTSTPTTTTPAATYTVDNGATIIVPVGAIVIAGPGGGSVSVGGVIIEVPANGKITANPDQAKKTDVEQTTEAPTSTETGACTMRTSTSTSAVSYGSNNVFVCQDLSGMDLAAVHSLFKANADANATATTPVAQAAVTPSRNNTLATVTTTPTNTPRLSYLGSTSTTSKATPSTATSIVETASPSADLFLAGLSCQLTKLGQGMCKTMVQGKAGACLTNEARTSGFLCVEDCPADSTCPQICTAAGYKGGYCANADYRCMCSNDDPTASRD